MEAKSSGSFNRDDQLFGSVFYDDFAPWPVTADGAGFTLPSVLPGLQIPMIRQLVRRLLRRFSWTRVWCANHRTHRCWHDTALSGSNRHADGFTCQRHDVSVAARRCRYSRCDRGRLRCLRYRCLSCTGERGRMYRTE